jgi:hypothetical protein
MSPNYAFGPDGTVSRNPANYPADALGITIEELRVAMERAVKAERAQAIVGGRITQEQAHQMAADFALHKCFYDKGLLKIAMARAAEDGVITQRPRPGMFGGGSFFGGPADIGGRTRGVLWIHPG